MIKFDGQSLRLSDTIFCNPDSIIQRIHLILSKLSLHSSRHNAQFRKCLVTQQKIVTQQRRLAKQYTSDILFQKCVGTLRQNKTGNANESAFCLVFGNCVSDSAYLYFLATNPVL